MEKKLQILFIINPKSGGKKNNNIIELVKETLDKSLFQADFMFTQRPKHATELSEDASRKNIDIVVAVGGDGTVREVAKGIVNSKTKLAIIPKGSGNGFAYHFKIPSNISKAVGIINKQKSLLIDTATINDEYFGNIVGIGFDAKVAWKFANSNKRGLLSYLKIIFNEYFKYKRQNYSFKLDKLSFSRKAFLVSVANGSQFGNNAYINPEASVTDGLLEVCILKKAAFFHSAFLAIRLLNKSLHKSKFLEVYKTKNALISCQKTDFTHIDGDSFEETNEISIKINSSTLNLIIP